MKPLLMSHDVYSLRFSPDGSRLLAAMWGNAGLAEIIVREGRVVPEVHTRSKENWLWTGTDDRLQARYAFVTRAIYLPGDRIAATSEKGFFDILDLNPPPSIQQVRCGDEMIWQVSASTDGKLIAAGGDGGVVSVWHVDDGMRGKFQHSELVRCVALSPDGTRVVSGGADNATRAWSVTDNREIQKLDGFEPSDIAFFKDGRRVAIAANDYRVYVWDFEDGKVIHRLGGHTHSVVTVAVSADQRLVASGSMDNTVRIWNAETGKPVARFGGHSMKITSVDFSPDGKWLASASLDKTVRMWPVPELTAGESTDESPEAKATPDSAPADLSQEP
jgi:WD40 repeat protein